MALAKRGFVLGAAIVFGTAIALARAHQPGQSTERLRPLGARWSYFKGVANNIGDAGIVRPPLSSPSAATNVS